MSLLPTIALSAAPAQATTPVAPSHPAGQGSSTPGGHYVAYKAQPKFDLESSIKLVSSVNPWRPGTPGHVFYSKVLAQNPGSVAKAVALGETAGFKAREVQNHLRWLFTWGGSYVEIGGKLYAAPAQSSEVVAKPVKAPVSKAKAPVKAK